MSGDTPEPVTWITVDDLTVALGESITVDDTWAATVVDAANDWAYRKRYEAGYVDDPTVAPSRDAKLGTTLYAVALYRERAATDSYPSFSELDGGGSFSTFGSMGQIKRLLGIGKAAVDSSLITLPPVGVLRRRGWWSR